MRSIRLEPGSRIGEYSFAVQAVPVAASGGGAGRESAKEARTIGVQLDFGFGPRPAFQNHVDAPPARRPDPELNTCRAGDFSANWRRVVIYHGIGLPRT